MALQTLRVYQIQRLIDDPELDIATDTTLANLIVYLKTGKTNPCPQCGGKGTIQEGTDVCPTCSGDGYTDVPYTIDRENSILKFKPV